MSRFLRILLATQVFIMGCGNAEPQKQPGIGKAQIDTLVQEMQAGRIGTVEILQIPASAVFRTRVTPELLEKWWDYKLTIRRLDYPRIDKLAAALKAVTVQQGDTGADMRWGVIFYSVTEQKRVAALSLDSSGRHGAVNDVLVSFGQGLGELRSILSAPY